MVNDIKKTRRIATNTMLLYFRMIIVMSINLYSVRILLANIGLEDYGLYNLIFGLVQVFLIFSIAFSNTTQRFYSTCLGSKGKVTAEFQRIFSASVTLFFILALTIIIIAETFGLWFVNNKLFIPNNRVFAVNCLYQLTIFSFIANIIQIPFSAAVISYQDLKFFSLISIFESILKLMAILALGLNFYDNLIIYGILILVISLVVLIAYFITATSRYDGCRYSKFCGKDLLRNFLTFSGWSCFASAAGVGINQVNTIITNIFFGPIVNAGRAISFQFNIALNSLVSSFILAVKAPMITSYAEESYTFLNRIFSLSNKLIYYSLYVVCLPIFIEMEGVLEFWLNHDSPETILFSRLILIYCVILALNNPISIIIQATGKMKEYHLPVELLTLSNVPITYFLFANGFPPYSTFVVMIGSAVVAHLVRLNRLKKFYKQFQYHDYFKSFLFPALLITLTTSFLGFLLHISISDSLLRLFTVFLVVSFSVLILVPLLGLSNYEKELVNKLISRIRLN